MVLLTGFFQLCWCFTMVFQDHLLQSQELPILKWKKSWKVTEGLSGWTRIPWSASNINKVHKRGQGRERWHRGNTETLLYCSEKGFVKPKPTWNWFWWETWRQQKQAIENVGLLLNRTAALCQKTQESTWCSRSSSCWSSLVKTAIRNPSLWRLVGKSATRKTYLWRMRIKSGNF